MFKKFIAFFSFLLTIITSANLEIGIAKAEFVTNPAAKYCVDLGYQWQTKMTDDGEIGICILPDGGMVDEWSFIKGEEGEKWNYCSQKGYKMKLVEDSEKCQNIVSTDCVVCVLDNKKEVEATELMAIESPPGECKGPFCSRIENSTSSTQQSQENITNNDQRQSSLGSKKLTVIVIGVLLFIIFIIIAIIYYIRKKKEKSNNNNIEYSKPNNE